MDAMMLEMLRRDSGLTLTSEGIFLYRGTPVANARVAALFHRGLSLNEAREVIVTVGPMWAYITCEGPYRFAERLTAGTVTLLGGTVVALVDPVWALGPAGRFHVWLHECEGPIRLLRGAQHDLEPWLHEKPEAQDEVVVIRPDQAAQQLHRWTQPLHPGSPAPTPGD